MTDHMPLAHAWLTHPAEAAAHRPDRAWPGQAALSVHGRLDRAARQLLDREQHRLDAIRSRPVLARPETAIDQRSADVAALAQRAARCLRHRLDRADADLSHTLARLRGLSPAATLQRGYAIVQRSGGEVVRDPADVVSREALRIRLAAGELKATAD